ncbi:uncharacterized protein LOC143613648 [Bidens hawaiensis]|uniref:uncharacterized protein LOC143613648 n=1 Tax=Bidens hawaiensis TaxID=980011 RepID=UPI0040491BCB
MVIAVPHFVSIGPWCGSCHSEGICCSTSYGITSNNWMRSSDNSESRFKCKNPFLGDTQIKWWPKGQKNSLSKVSVAADYPDSVPESSNYVPNNGYHQLEELKNSKRVRETKLTGAETAKTTIELRLHKAFTNYIKGVSVLGCLSPAYVDEELYKRRLFSIEDGDGYDQNWKDEDTNYSASIFYRLEIMRVELFSVYGVQATINLQDFRDAKPDILVHSIPDIIAHFGDDTMDCNLALKSLCKKNGFYVEEANIIGVDSLGIDVRVFTGLEVRTHRFPFKIWATSETAAEKQIQQLLFPRARRKRLSRTRIAAT